MLRVVVGVIFNKDNKVLIAKRKIGQFKEGFWEFAGGKVEDNESLENAIIRELNEELGIEVINLEYKFELNYTYPEKKVNLSIFVINNYLRKVKNNENQEIKWVEVSELKTYNLLPTVMPIINQLTLPRIYHIINFDDNFWQNFTNKLSNIKMLQLRSKSKIKTDIIEKIYNKCRENNIKLILNITNIKENLNFCDGYHITSKNLINPIIYPNKLISCATHNENEIKMANKINADIITLSPINQTNTHSNAEVLGFEKARELTKNSTSLVYFLGGMSLIDLEKVQNFGGFGIAGISKIK